MVLDFDVRIFCQNLRATKPPYKCPVEKCGKIYKSYSGIQFHMYHFDHDNPDNTPSRKARKSNVRGRTPSPPDFHRSTRETLTYAEAQRLVEVDLDGKIHRINIYEPLGVIEQDEIDNCDNTEKEELPEKILDKTPQKPVKESSKSKKDSAAKTPSKTPGKTPGVPEQSQPVKLPEASFRVLDDFVKPPKAPPRPTNYIRYMEKNTEDLDEEVEYDMDEEDYAWLQLVNSRRSEESQVSVSQETFETLMDRFEKEAFFQSHSTGKEQGPSIDEDAVCSICMDGECQNSNQILFCDMCNLAVHQECYGVPYIPEGQWLCRRCLQSPSRAADCCLCPNKGGAFKQTDDARWAHVVCALWIPEVGFANTVFLEPIDSIEHIPAARWKLSCYICKQRGTGACIQCHKTNCYTAFHVTCAQQAALYMKIEPVRENGANGLSVSVRKTAFCDVHAPSDDEVSSPPAINEGFEEDDLQVSPAEVKAQSRAKMRQARKILAQKRNAVPVVSIPTLSPQKMARIAGRVAISQKGQFLQLLKSYWTLKRQSRNGVPLLRRLQSNHMTRNKEMAHSEKEHSELKSQLKYWQRLRQDLEKARLLIELIRKREKLKREQVKIHQMAMELKLQPFVMVLRQALDELVEKDPGTIFTEPVDLKEVPDYMDYIGKPMDLSTMRHKVETHQYKTVADFEADFDLMINNCLKYNGKDTTFYRAAIRLRDQGGAIIRMTHREVEKISYDPETGMHTQDPPKHGDSVIAEDDTLLSEEQRKKMPLEEQLKLLLDKLDTATGMRPNRRSRIVKILKKEVIKVRRQLSLQKGNERLMSEQEDFSAADSDEEMPSITSSRSPSPEKLPSNPRSQSAERRDSLSTPPPSTSSPFPGRGRGSSRGRGRGRGRGAKRDGSRTDTDTEQTPSVKGQRDRDGSSESRSFKEKQLAAPTPMGVNRRTTVLFTNKSLCKTAAQSAGSTSSGNSTPEHNSASRRRRPGRPARPKPHGIESAKPIDSLAKKTDSAITLKHQNVEKVHESPGPSTRKRSSSTTTSNITESLSADLPSKRSSSLSDPPLLPSGPSLDTGSLFSDAQKKESFTQYRSTGGLISDIDTASESGSSDSSLSDSDSSKQSSSDSADGEMAHRYSRRVRTKKRTSSWTSSDYEDDNVIPLEPLDLVWAKCRGYPWYPALIISPKMPRTGYFHNGVPIPVPPEDVLQLCRKYEDPVYLVLFFDTKRTWQWLPRNKLEPLGVDSGLDKAKLHENKKPNVKKAVKKAYEKAISHRCRVTGEPNPVIPPSIDSDDDVD